MLPFDQKPWAKHLAVAVIGITVLGLAVLAMALRRVHPLDVAEITFIILVLIAVVPPNLAIILRRNPLSANLNDVEPHAKA